MKILIIEDEIPAADQIAKAVSAHDSTIEILDVLDSNAAILEWFERSTILPDLIFSDIELLDGVVFNALLTLDIKTPIIFTTAYHQFTMDAFETSGIAYLLKPIDPELLKKAITKYEHLTKPATAVDLSALLNKLNIADKQTYKSRFSVKIGAGIYLLNTDEIACLSMKKGVLHAYKENGKSFILSYTLADAYHALDPARFHLINRSDIVNINFIDKVENYYNDRLAVQIKGQPKALITSASRTSEFRKWLEG